MACAVVTLSLIACASVAAVAAQRTPAEVPREGINTVYVTAVEGTGALALDLAAGDLAIKEDGKARTIVRVEVAHAPMHIEILVDDNGTGLFRYGLVQFVQQLQGRAEMALSTVIGQTLKLVDYTPNAETVANAVTALTARPGTPDGGQLLEGIFQASKEQQRREAERPIIVALTVGGEEHSTLPAHHVLDQLAKSGSTLYVISVASSALRSTRRIDKPSALLEENLNLSEVLGEGPKQTGGWSQEIIAAAGITQGLQRLASELKNQYAVAYSRPSAGRATNKITITTSRRGLTLRAPTKVRGR